MKLHKNIVAAAILILALIAGGALYYLSAKNSSKPHQTNSDKNVYKLRFGHNMPKDSAMGVAASKFAEVVSQKTNGKVSIEIYPNQELGNDHKMIEMAVGGDLDILLSPTAKMSAVLPAMQYSDIPFLFPHKEDAYAMLDGEPGKLLLDELNQYGLIGITFWGNGFKQFTANREIHSPGDFKNVNVRVMKSPMIMDQFREFNGNPIPIDFAETYKALKDKVVEAQENPIAAIYGMKFHEVQTHIIISNHAYLAYVFCFSKKTLDKLPPDIQQTLITTAKELTNFERQLIDSNEADLLKKMADSGAKILYLNDNETKRFQLASKSILYKYTPVIGDEIIDATTEYLKQKYNLDIGNEIIIGLNADMTLGSAQAGIAIERGMKLAVKEINERSGILGKKLMLVTMDHAGNVSRSNENIREFAKIKNLVAVMGGQNSHIVLRDLKLIHSNNIIYLIPWAAHPEIVQNGFDPNYVFRLSANDTYVAPFLLNQALKRTKKIALIRVNSAWGTRNEEIMVKYLKEQKLSFTTVESFNVGDTDFYNQIERIYKSGAEVIIMIAQADEGALIVKHIFHTGKKIPIIAHRAMTGGNFYTEVKKELKTIDLSFIQTYSFLTANNTSLVQEYMKEYNIKTPQEIFSPSGTASAYDLVYLLAEAIKQAAAIDRELVRNALENIVHFEGLSKTHSPPFTKDRHDALDESAYFMAVYDSNGVIVPIHEDKK
ncbi:DctP family TRAP transporter solute-binding subunit [Candidatus Magnetomonas plexicatena]|uniref:DctP family TRAP transporter solute-binding subunit n=1 Tax=Candidatus Magnetomonas plexicatena TaxID=2552947 RepID=UPI001C794266|nr:DctP family TRAP transporter solute-binding subunit [Nitrospirales bacterium LBB_01]